MPWELSCGRSASVRPCVVREREGGNVSLLIRFEPGVLVLHGLKVPAGFVTQRWCGFQQGAVRQRRDRA